MHPPFSRGVTQLMYVGDVPVEPSPASIRMRDAAVAIGGIVALFGGDLGVSKTTRRVAGVVAIGALVSSIAG